MKKTITSIAIAAMALVACNPVKPNHEGILMQNYGRNGISDFTMITGNAGVLGPGTELYLVPMYEQTADPHEVTIMAKGGGLFQVDPIYTYEAIRGKGVDIVFNYKHANINDGLDTLESIVLSPIVINAYREEARKYSTDSLINYLNEFEANVQNRLTMDFEQKYFKLNNLTSGLKPDQSMVDAIQRKNEAKQYVDQVRNELEASKALLEKAKIDAERNNVESSGLTKEILQARWIEAIRNTTNKVIITDGNTPLMLQQ